MSKKKDETSETAPGPSAQTVKAGPIPYTIHAQYIRDASFENPDALEALKPGKAMPEMDINIGMDARRVEDDDIPFFFEVVLNIKAEAKREGQTLFIAELQYGLAVSIDEKVPEDSHHPLLLIEIPRFAFPFARQIMSDLTSQGGFPPLMISPVDFHALYIERFSNEAKKTDADTPENEAES